MELERSVFLEVQAQSEDWLLFLECFGVPEHFNSENISSNGRKKGRLWLPE